MDLFSMGGLAKAVALAFGAATIAAPRLGPGRTAGSSGGHPTPRETLPFARRADAVDLVVPVLPMPPAPEPARVRPRAAAPAKLALAPRVAARRFVAFMQANDWHGERPWAGKNGVWEFYLFHCAYEDLAPLPDNLFGAALAKIAKKRIVRARIEGLPERPTFYAIPPAPEARSAHTARQKPAAARARRAA